MDALTNREPSICPNLPLIRLYRITATLFRLSEAHWHHFGGYSVSGIHYKFKSLDFNKIALTGFVTYARRRHSRHASCKLNR